MVQEETDEPERVDIVMLTHDAREGDVTAAIEAIDTEPFILSPSRFLRVAVPA